MYQVSTITLAHSQSKKRSPQLYLYIRKREQPTGFSLTAEHFSCFASTSGMRTSAQTDMMLRKAAATDYKFEYGKDFFLNDWLKNRNP